MEVDYSNPDLASALDCYDDWHRMLARSARAIKAGDAATAGRMATVLRLVAEDLARYASGLVSGGCVNEARFVTHLHRWCEEGTDGVVHAIRNMA